MSGSITVYKHVKQNTESLLEVIREQGKYPFRNKGAGSKGQKSQWSREHGNCNQRAGSTIFLSKKAAESELGVNPDLLSGLLSKIGASTQQDGLFFLSSL